MCSVVQNRSHPAAQAPLCLLNGQNLRLNINYSNQNYSIKRTPHWIFWSVFDMLYEMTIDANRPSRHSLEININIGLKSLFTYSIWELKFQTTVISMHAKTIRHNKKGSAASTTSQDGLQDAPCVLYRFLKWATPVVHHTLDTPPRTIIYFWMSTIQFLAFNSDDRHVYIGLFELTNDVLAISWTFAF